MVAVLYGKLIFVESTVQDLRRPPRVGDCEADIPVPLRVHVPAPAGTDDADAPHDGAVRHESRAL